MLQRQCWLLKIKYRLSFALDGTLSQNLQRDARVHVYSVVHGRMQHVDSKQREDVSGDQTQTH